MGSALETNSTFTDFKLLALLFCLMISGLATTIGKHDAFQFVNGHVWWWKPPYYGEPMLSLQKIFHLAPRITKLSLLNLKHGVYYCSIAQQYDHKSMHFWKCLSLQFNSFDMNSLTFKPTMEY